MSRPYDSDPYGRWSAASDRPASDRPASDRPASDRPAGEPTGAWGHAPAGGWGGDPEPGRGGGYGDEPRYGWRPQNEPSWNQNKQTRPRVSAQQRGRRRLLVAIVTALVVVLVIVLGFVTPGWFVTRVFDAGAVQAGVAKVLADDYATDGVADVRCPQNVQVTAGATFTCDATIDGDPVTIPIRVTDDRGAYQVGRPA